jgi:hypothetical protein
VRSKQVWRHYCDHCGKGGFSKPAMVKHEKHCTNNPNRECRMCAIIGEAPVPMPELLAVLEGIPYQSDQQEPYLKALREKTLGCPACMLAAIRQHLNAARKNYSPDDCGEWPWVTFDFKEERTAFFRDHPREMPGFEAC